MAMATVNGQNIVRSANLVQVTKQVSHEEMYNTGSLVNCILLRTELDSDGKEHECQYAVVADDDSTLSLKYDEVMHLLQNYDIFRTDCDANCRKHFSKEFQELRDSLGGGTDGQKRRLHFTERCSQTTTHVIVPDYFYSDHCTRTCNQRVSQFKKNLTVIPLHVVLCKKSTFDADYWVREQGRLTKGMFKDYNHDNLMFQIPDDFDEVQVKSSGCKESAGSRRGVARRMTRSKSRSRSRSKSRSRSRSKSRSRSRGRTYRQKWAHAQKKQLKSFTHNKITYVRRKARGNNKLYVYKRQR